MRLSRRNFMQTLGLSGAAAAVGSAVLSPPSDAASPDDATSKVLGPGAAPIALTVNGKATTVTVDCATTLLEALREHLGMIGSKEVCDRGACGACSVLVDGVLVASCMMLAADAAGARVTTVEGLSQGETLSPLQQAFIKHDALQCGYCTPGLVVACQALLERTPKPTMEQIRRGLSGNICRCGTYTNIFNAVLEASGQPVPVDPSPTPVTIEATGGSNRGGG